MKKTSVTFIAIILLFTFFSFPAGSQGSDHSYVALGDSIAFGYGVTPRETFVTKVAGLFNLDFNNHAVNGDTSQNLLDILTQAQSDKGSELYKQLENACLITVTIGSNDLLGRLIEMFGEKINMEDPSLDGIDLSELIGFFNDPEVLAEFDAGVEEYRKNLPLIYQAIRSINTDAQIIMTDFYNPFYGLKILTLDFSSLCDSYIVKLNQIIHQGAQTMDYTIAQVYEDMNKAGMSNVNILTGQLDPHPSVAGHEKFTEIVAKAVDTERLSSLTGVIPPTLPPFTPSPNPTPAPTSEPTAIPAETTTPGKDLNENSLSPVIFILTISGGILLVAVILFAIHRKKK